MLHNASRCIPPVANAKLALFRPCQSAEVSTGPICRLAPPESACDTARMVRVCHYKHRVRVVDSWSRYDSIQVYLVPCTGRGVLPLYKISHQQDRPGVRSKPLPIIHLMRIKFEHAYLHASEMRLPIDWQRKRTRASILTSVL